MSAIEKWAAVMLNGRAAPRVGWGPIADRREADDFARFVSDEIDPAKVIPLRSAASELLAWRSAAVIKDSAPLRPATDAPPMLGDHMAGTYGFGVPGASQAQPGWVRAERAATLAGLADSWDAQASGLAQHEGCMDAAELGAELLHQAARQLRERLGDAC